MDDYSDYGDAYDIWRRKLVTQWKRSSEYKNLQELPRSQIEEVRSESIISLVQQYLNANGLSPNDNTLSPVEIARELNVKNPGSVRTALHRLRNGHVAM